jgi:pre-mRNA-splicing factor CDC5/CEF1
MSASPWGGAWSNAEDQVLLAACAKYGIGTSWARISSLIPKKTAKQCKARYEMYLNPTIKKTEWTREEDERLLHMTKVFPGGQWATIAVMMDGRTQYQCQERYNKLLDEEAAREHQELAAGLGPAEAAPSEEVRRLQPGEVDTQAESRPAKYVHLLSHSTIFLTRPPRPDAINMDDVDLEMLQEARARMANTKGKKAKRKEREARAKLAYQAAKLGKRRELKLSGINLKINPFKKGEMDYNANIPFERIPDAGFHDTTEELTQNEREHAAFDPRKQQLANTNKRKIDGEDEDEESHKKRKENRNDQQGPSAAALKAARMQKIREAEQSSQRRPLILPAPQVSDYELEDIVKVGLSDQRAAEAALAGENVATRGLISEYGGGTVGATPMRTPFRTPGPGATPLRRDLSIMGPPGTSSAVSRLSALPKPQMTDWEFELPDEQEQLATTTDTPEDAAIRDAKAKAAREAAEREDFARQTQVVQRRLPRPTVVDYDAMVKSAETIRDPIRRAIALETAKVVANDAVKFGGAKVSGKVPPLAPMSDDSRAKVHQAIADECAKLDNERNLSKEAVISAVAELHKKKSKIPGLAEYADSSDEDEIDEHQLMVETFDNVQEKIMATAQKNNELEKKLNLHHGGYIKRNAMLRGKIGEAYDALEKLNIQLETAKYAQVREGAAIARRLEKKKEEARLAKKNEMEAQEEYRKVKEEWDALNAAQVNGTH